MPFIPALIDLVLLAFLIATAFFAIRLRDLFGVAMLFGIYSLLSAGLFVTLDAVDVALTEAAVGAGITTVLFLVTLRITGRRERRPAHRPLVPLIVVLITGAALVYGTHDLPAFGDARAPIHRHVAPRYIHESPEEVGIPNMVTSVLASYRGYDTLGEVTVIFTAGVGVLMLLGMPGRRRPSPAADKDGTDE